MELEMRRHRVKAGWMLAKCCKPNFHFRLEATMISSGDAAQGRSCRQVRMR